MHAAPSERASGPRCASFERLAGPLASAAPAGAAERLSDRERRAGYLRVSYTFHP
jgi:hypothetical protein